MQLKYALVLAGALVLVLVSVSAGAFILLMPTGGAVAPACFVAPATIATGQIAAFTVATGQTAAFTLCP
jgi:hypothetical protein